MSKQSSSPVVCIHANGRDVADLRKLLNTFDNKLPECDDGEDLISAAVRVLYTLIVKTDKKE